MASLLGEPVAISSGLVPADIDYRLVVIIEGLILKNPRVMTAGKGAKLRITHFSLGEVKQSIEFSLAHGFIGATARFAAGCTHLHNIGA